jgi:hypothetical protein
MIGPISKVVSFLAAVALSFAALAQDVPRN